MAQTQVSKAPATVHCVVVRALCIGGERQDVGTQVELTAAQYADCLTAGKVAPLEAKAADAPKARAPKAAKEAAKEADKAPE